MRKGALQRDNLQCAFLINFSNRLWPVPATMGYKCYFTSTISRLMDARSLAPHMAIVSLSSAPIFSM